MGDKLINTTKWYNSQTMIVIRNKLCSKEQTTFLKCQCAVYSVWMRCCDVQSWALHMRLPISQDTYSLIGIWCLDSYSTLFLWICDPPNAMISLLDHRNPPLKHKSINYICSLVPLTTRLSILQKVLVVEIRWRCLPSAPYHSSCHSFYKVRSIRTIYGWQY